MGIIKAETLEEGFFIIILKRIFIYYSVFIVGEIKLRYLGEERKELVRGSSSHQRGR